MVDDFFTFNGRSTKEFGMAVESYPEQNAPKRRRKAIQIPGRNGDLHIDEEAFENIDVPYKVWFKGDLPTPEQAHAVKGWLLGGKGYKRLEDKYDPGHFRLASFAGPMNISNILSRYGKCKIVFDCDPRCFRKDGEFPIKLENAGIIYNPTEFTTKPLVKVYGNAAGTVTVGNITVEIKSITTAVALDCENEHAYALGDVQQSLNHTIYAPYFPALHPGENMVQFDGGITAVEIIPRWWDV